MLTVGSTATKPAVRVLLLQYIMIHEAVTWWSMYNHNDKAECWSVNAMSCSGLLTTSELSPQLLASFWLLWMDVLITIVLTKVLD